MRVLMLIGPFPVVGALVASRSWSQPPSSSLPRVPVRRYWRPATIPLQVNVATSAPKVMAAMGTS